MIKRLWLVNALMFVFALTGWADAIAVRQPQGSMHGFLVIRSAEGKIIAAGDLVSMAKGDQVHSRIIFHFHDGSIDDETTTFKQSSTFQVLTDHHVQKGPSFPQPQDVTLNTLTGQVTWRDEGETKSEHMDLPGDLANGLMSLLVQNFPPDKAQVSASYLAGGSKPRLVKLLVRQAGQDFCQIGSVRRRSERFSIHIELGGVSGLVAPILGKQPEDIAVWVLPDQVPTFIKMQGPLYLKGPIWSMELASPVWPETR